MLSCIERPQPHTLPGVVGASISVGGHRQQSDSCKSYLQFFILHLLSYTFYLTSYTFYSIHFRLEFLV
jgi:hypothetical protein